MTGFMLEAGKIKCGHKQCLGAKKEKLFCGTLSCTPKVLGMPW
jgi:hypothetical protein